jgi:hypothetical protein
LRSYFSNDFCTNITDTGSGPTEDLFYSVKNFQRGKNAETGKEPLRSYLLNYFCTNITDTGSGLTEDLFYSVENFQRGKNPETGKERLECEP